jgi:hypothetical protein
VRRHARLDSVKNEVQGSGTFRERGEHRDTDGRESAG